MVDRKLDIPEPQDHEEEARDKQIAYIRSATRKTGVSEFPEELLNDLGKWRASANNDRLKDLEATLGGDSSKFDSSKFTEPDEDSQNKFGSIYIWGTLLVAGSVVLVAVIGLVIVLNS